MHRLVRKYEALCINKLHKITKATTVNETHQQKSLRYLHRDGEVIPEKGLILPDLLDLCFQLLSLQAGLLLELVHLLHQLGAHRC